MTSHTAFTRKKPTCNIGLRWLSSALLLLSLLLTSFTTSVWAQTTDGPTPRIIGGTATNPSDYPWAVALLRSNISDGFNAQFCGGTLIADRWILTAAHCVDNFSSASEIEVAIGISNLNEISNADRLAINTIFVHPDYNVYSQDNDIALLELTTPSSDATLSIADNTLTDTITPGELMTVIGWGTTSSTTFSYPNLLQEVDVPLFDFASCNDIYASALTSNMLCAGFAEGGKDTCQGDSGGPMLYFNTGDSTYYQTGITSFGNGCAEPDNPGVYTRAANYIDWINATTSITIPNRYHFGFHGIGHSTSTTLTLRNYSGADINVTGVNLSNTIDFSIASETCTGNNITNNGSCSITLQFLTNDAGNQFATLSIDFGSGNPSLNSTISGIGLASIDASTLDEATDRNWYSGGDASWSSVSIANSTGGSAMRSGAITDTEDTAIISYFNGPDTLSFRWKASTEQDYDFLKVYVDGVLVESLSGDQDWLTHNIELSAGEHRVAWVYEKDITISKLSDSAWLDNVNTLFSSADDTGGGFSRGGGGTFSQFFLLLLALVLMLRKGLFLLRYPVPSSRYP